jgi:hypothetical protein
LFSLSSRTNNEDISKNQNSSKDEKHLAEREVLDKLRKFSIKYDLFWKDPAIFYGASSKVYDMLYSYYLQNGELENALKMHYRRNEVKRKLKLLGGWRDKLGAWLYDWLILKILTGYGVKPERPIYFSIFVIFLFSMLFMIVNGRIQTNAFSLVTYWDYLYFSFVTFSSLGYVNLKLNLADMLVRTFIVLEAFMGYLAMSLFIYTLTYRVSK